MSPGATAPPQPAAEPAELGWQRSLAVYSLTVSMLALWWQHRVLYLHLAPRPSLLLRLRVRSTCSSRISSFQVHSGEGETMGVLC